MQKIENKKIVIQFEFFNNCPAYKKPLKKIAALAKAPADDMAILQATL